MGDKVVQGQSHSNLRPGHAGNKYTRGSLAQLDERSSHS